jgi:hypothetical protein
MQLQPSAGRLSAFLACSVIGIALTGLGVSPSWAGNAVLPESGQIELVTWVPGKEEYKFTQLCTLAAKVIHCTGTMRFGQTETAVVLDGTAVDGVLDLKYSSTTRYFDPTCNAEYAVKSSTLKLTLDDGGNGSGTWGGGTGTWTKASEKCALLVGKSDQHGPEANSTSWRVISAAPEQAGFGDAQIRSALWKQLGQAEGPLARKCFDDAFGKLNEPRNADLKERISAAAYQQHIIGVTAALSDADDFDPQWLEAAKGIGGAGGMGQSIGDKIVKLLPGPFGTLISLSQKAYRLANGVNEKAVVPLLKGKLYDAFRAERAQRLNDPAVEVLKDASTAVGSWTMLKTNLIKHFPGANDEERENAMANYLAARFDFVYRAREIAANKEKLEAQAWAPAANDVARVRSTMLDCMTK